MPFLILLLQIICATSLFFGLGYLLRKRLPTWTRILYLLGGILTVLLAFIWTTEVAGWQRRAHLNQLLYNLRNAQFRAYLETQAPREETLFFLSLTSQAIFQEIDRHPERKAELLPFLRWMADWVTEPERFPQWRSPGSWNRELFFLSHAGILIGHYQLVSLDERHGDAWQDIGRFVATGLTRSRYKHLASRQRDEALRTYDNAAALYMLYLFDGYFGEEAAYVAVRDWSTYISNELKYNGFTLPCAGFSMTNRCRLEPTATSSAILTGYTAATGATVAKDFWRAYKHLFKREFLVISARFNPAPRGGELPPFCETTVVPLQCATYQNELSQWAAAARGDWLSYYQLHTRLYLRDIFGGNRPSWEIPVGQRLPALIQLAARSAAETI